MKKNKGITLVALIITIIVMLILVGVSISVLINSDLIGTAQNAGDRTETAYEQEGNIGEIKVGDVYYNSIEDYIAGNARSHNWQYTDATMEKIKCTCAECSKVNLEGVTLTIGQSVSNYSAGPEGTEWIVFGVESIDNDAEYENVLITTNPSREILTLSAETDSYNTGISQIEAKVDEIYGTEARGMTIEDVNRTLGYTPAGGMYLYGDEGLKSYSNFDTTIKEYLLEYAIMEYKKDNSIEGDLNEEQLADVEENVDTLLNAAEDETRTIKIDGYMYGADTTISEEFEIPGLPSASSSINIRNIVFGEEYVLSYWLASRGNIGVDYDVCRGCSGVLNGIVSSTIQIFDNDSAPVRPVVSLGANVLSVVGE